ncbi:MAG TPA: alpha/beta fold hydrolase [Pyrinomonadaceae bacterium]|jgi:medium-chain acyl-[acyl-carrier-protein] hydrolase
MSQQPDASLWFRALNRHPRCRARLFCFPYAGGAAAVFRAWPAGLAPDVEVFPALLPGRGVRMSEPPLTRISSIVEHLAAEIRPHLDRPFALFGHSMGALVAFELARRLRAEAGVEPAHLFVSGCRAPHIPDPDPPVHDRADSEFIEHLRELNGTPAEALNHPQLMELMLPLLRADFEAVETYRYEAGAPLGCRVSVYGGLADTAVRREHLEAWREQTGGEFVLRMFDGDHFFIHQAAPQLLRTLDRELARVEGAHA